MPNNKEDHQNWDRHVWSGVPQRQSDIAFTRRMYDETRGMSDSMADAYTAAEYGKQDQVAGISGQQFDGDAIAWRAFLEKNARSSGKPTIYSGGAVQEKQFKNAVMVDKWRRREYMQYIHAGGTMNYNDWLKHTGMHSKQGMF